MATQGDIMNMLQGQYYWIDETGHSNASKTFFVKGYNIINVTGFGAVTTASLSIEDDGTATWADGVDRDTWIITVPELGWDSRLTVIDSSSLTVITNFAKNQRMSFTHVPPTHAYDPHENHPPVPVGE